MARPQIRFSSDTLGKIRALLKNAGSPIEIRRMQCILFREAEGMNAEKIGTLVGFSTSYVRTIWQKYKRYGEKILMGDHRGGRYRSHLTVSQEKAFLAPFLEQASRGGILIVSDIRQAYEKKIKQPVHHSVIYRLLARYGWRKITPRPSHPKTNREAQEAFKASFPPEHPRGTARGRSSRPHAAGDVPG